MAAYLQASGGDEDLAVALYEWNVDLSGAFLEVTHNVEVTLRNRLHRELSTAFPDNPDPWYRQGGVLHGPKGPDAVTEAERRIVQRGDNVTAGRVIAQLPFGFWNALFGHDYEALWRRSLHHCFKPHGPSRRKDVAAHTERIRLFRNSVAHHERLFHKDLLTRHDDLLKLVMWIDPNARDWIAAKSRVPILVAARPR